MEPRMMTSQTSVAAQRMKPPNWCVGSELEAMDGKERMRRMTAIEGRIPMAMRRQKATLTCREACRFQTMLIGQRARVKSAAACTARSCQLEKSNQ